jgi:hypothetical protein
MNAFDKFCAIFSFLIGLIFILFGVLGAFAGVRLWITLPPILGIFPAIVGWGTVRAIYFAWNAPKGPTENFSDSSEFGAHRPYQTPRKQSDNPFESPQS